MRKYYDEVNEEYERGYKDGMNSILSEARKSKYDKMAEDILSYMNKYLKDNDKYYWSVYHNKSTKSIEVYCTFTLKHESYMSGFKKYYKSIDYLNFLLKDIKDTFTKDNKNLKVIEDYLTKEKVQELQKRAENYGDDDWSIEHSITTSILFKY